MSTGLQPLLISSVSAAAPSSPTLVEALHRAAAADAPFVTFHGSGEPKHFDARAALDSGRRWAWVLKHEGVARGGCVAILLSTSTDFIGALLGTMLLGALPLPLASPMTFGSVDRYVAHLGRVVRHAGARVLVTSARVRDAVRALPLASELDSVIVPAEVEHVTGRSVGVETFDPSMPALLQYTSGTTGRPKGVLITHGALMANTAAIARGLSLSERDVGVSWLPLYHDMGLVGVVLTALAHPYALHLIAPEGFVMKPRRWLELIAQHRGTISTAPNFAYDYAAERVNPEGLDLSSWRAALNGAEPIHACTLDRFVARFEASGFARNALTPVYGLAEATLAVTIHPTGEPAKIVRVDRHALDVDRNVVDSPGAGRALVAVGTPVPGTSIAITDQHGRGLGAGEVGEIRVSGPGLMREYYRDAEATSAALVGGWLRTGDIGFVRDESLYISGRARELIIQAGRNVHPEDVEEVALEVDARIRCAAAFARASEQRGTDDLVLVLEARGLTAGERDALVHVVRGQVLAAIGVRADAVAFWPLGTIPRTSSGKVRRQECAAMYAGAP